MRLRKGNVLLAVLAVLAIFAIGAAGYFVLQRQTAISPKNPAASFKTKNGVLGLFFQNSNYPVRETPVKAFDGDSFTGQRYTLDGGPVRSFYIDYYPTVKDLKAKTDFTRDSDGDNAGVGCMTTPDIVNANGVNLQKVTCYYNPISITKSGKYMPGTSSVSGTECIYWIDRAKTEALYFWGVAEVGHDTCQFVQQELKGFEVRFVII